MSDFLAENRHTELSHQDALAAAQAEHERVRLAAIRVYKDHELKEEHRRLQEHEEIIRQQQRREEERIRNEERLRAEEERLRALKAKTVPKLPPAEPLAAQPSSTIAPTSTSTSTAQLNGSGPPNATINTSSANNQNIIGLNAKAPPFVSQQPTFANAPFLQVNGTKVVQQVPSQLLGKGQHAAPSKTSSLVTPTTTGSFLEPASSQQNIVSTLPTSKPPVDRYVVIHQNLKKLRASLAEQAKSLPPLKARMGDMRRELRKSLGQIVTEKGGNKKQVRNCLRPYTMSANMLFRLQQSKRYF
jgi:nucleoporin GLE1